MIHGKERLLALLKLLYEQTDEQHPITTTEIIKYFAERGTNTDRKTVKQDVETLIEHGYDIVVLRTTQNAYFIGSRMFSLPELKLLIDAVESSKFITAKKSKELTDKLSRLASVHQAAQLQRHLYIAERVKPANEQIYYIVDRIHSAINDSRQISFQYFEYNAQRQKVFRNNGKRYRFSPYGLLWNEDRYYTVGYSEKHGRIVTFRVDRMLKVEIQEEKAVPEPDSFSLSEFARQVFDMYDGQTEKVSLICTNAMMKFILDRFGEEAATYPIDNDHFCADVELSVSRTFFAWVFQFCGDIRIASPAHVAEEYEKMLKNALK